MSSIDAVEIQRVIEVIRDVGYCVVSGLIPRALCAQVRSVYMKILRREKAENLHPSGHQRILHLLIKDPIFTGLLCDPFGLAVWRRYLGEDVIRSTMTANALWPNSTELYWHVDHFY
jgi:hypothetical protein